MARGEGAADGPRYARADRLHRLLLAAAGSRYGGPGLAGGTALLWAGQRGAHAGHRVGVSARLVRAAARRAGTHSGSLKGGGGALGGPLQAGPDVLVHAQSDP